MSTDADRIENFVVSFHDVWLTPLVIAQVFYLLYQQLGPPCFACVGYVALTAPLGQLLAQGWCKYGELEMKEKDKRIKVIREVLNGIRVVKFQSWSSVFLERISAIRNCELGYLSREKLYDGTAFIFFNLTPPAMSVIAISTFSATGGLPSSVADLI